MQTSLTSTCEKHVNFAQFKEIRSSAKRKKKEWYTLSGQTRKPTPATANLIQFKLHLWFGMKLD